MTCADCKHWNKREESKYHFGPKPYAVGDCFKSSFAKAFGKQTTAYDGGVGCGSFEEKVSE